VATLALEGIHGLNTRTPTIPYSSNFSIFGYTKNKGFFDISESFGNIIIPLIFGDRSLVTIYKDFRGVFRFGYPLT
jgi:hypothetical protein